MSTINEQMTLLADAIRSKSGATGKLSITAMTSAVDSIEINSGSDIDFTGVNVTADALKEGVVAVNSSGVKITGTAPVVSLSQDGNTVSIAKGFTNGGSITITPEEPETPTAATVTVSKNIVTITAGTIKAQTITLPESVIDETDEQVTVGVGYIPEQMVIEKGSAGSGASFAKVTKYIPGHAAYEKVESIQVSGFGYNEDTGEDYSAWNGTYGISEQSITEKDVNKTIFEHPDGGKYLYRIYDEENGDYYWIFNTSTNGSYLYDALYYKSELESGDWESYEYGSVTLAIAKSSIEYAESPEVLEAVEVTFDSEKGSFTTAETPVTISAYETTPKALGIYLSTTGNRLIGQNITFDLSELYAAFENLFAWVDDMPDFSTDVYDPVKDFDVYFPLTEDTPFDPENQVAVRDIKSGIELFKTGGSVRGGVVSAFDDTTCWTNGWNKGNYLSGTIDKNFLPQDSMSIMFLAYYPQTTIAAIEATVIDFGSHENSTGFGVWSTNNNSSTVGYRLRIGENHNVCYISCPLNSWHVIGFSFEPLNEGYLARAYLDGHLVSCSELNSTQYIHQDTTVALFGRKGVNSESDASSLVKLQEVRVWKGAASDDFMYREALEYAKRSNGKILIPAENFLTQKLSVTYEPWYYADYEVTASYAEGTSPGIELTQEELKNLIHRGNSAASNAKCHLFPDHEKGAWIQIERINNWYPWKPIGVGIIGNKYTGFVFEGSYRHTNAWGDVYYEWHTIAEFTNSDSETDELHDYELPTDLYPGVEAPDEMCYPVWRFRFFGTETIRLHGLFIYRGEKTTED